VGFEPTEAFTSPVFKTKADQAMASESEGLSEELCRISAELPAVAQSISTPGWPSASTTARRHPGKNVVAGRKGLGGSDKSCHALVVTKAGSLKTKLVHRERPIR